ncbi:MAG TPA: hypothetical protein VFE63_18470 [Roseiarcus sp.]|nr:hypothetical protein [Roseiarcus sp.]
MCWRMHGLPLAFYSDRHGIFRVNAKEAQGGDGLTEFGRVAERLRIELIHAATPQAKGRVERANQTLQDRLIKEMRLAGVSSIDEAQAFADGFLERWNKRFAVAPRQAEDAHRPWSGSKADLAEALARREERTLSKALTFSAGATRYAIKTQGAGTALRGARVTFCTCSTEPCACASKTATWPSRHSRACPSRLRSKTIKPSTPASTRS